MRDDGVLARVVAVEVVRSLHNLKTGFPKRLDVPCERTTSKSDSKVFALSNWNKWPSIVMGSLQEKQISWDGVRLALKF